MTRHRYTLSRAAASDLRELHEWISRDDRHAADRVTTDLRDAMRRLAELPELGHPRDDLSDEQLRVWPVRSYLVVYRPHSSPLQIVRVVSGYRDLTALDVAGD